MIRPNARPAAFLDRDGVLIRDTGYPFRPEHLLWLDRAIEAVRWLNEQDYEVVVVTNQSGVARGLFGEEDVQAFHQLMQSQLLAASARVDAFYYCPYHPEGVVERYRRDHPWRKPAPGMIVQAFEDLPIRRAGSFLVGDKPSDLQAAAAAGIPSFLSDGSDLLARVQSAAARAAAPSS